MPPDFSSLMNPAAIGQGIQSAFDTGRETRRQMETQRAMADYASNPSEQSAFAVARHDPLLGIKLGQVERERAATEKKEREAAIEQQLIGDALNGNVEARQKLAYINSDAYIKLDDRQKAAADTMMKAIAQQAFDILQLPEEQRGPALQQALQGLQAQGVDTSGFRLTGDPTRDLKAALAMAGQLDSWEQFAQPKYTPVGEAGLAGFQFGVPIMDGGSTRNFAPPVNWDEWQVEGGASSNAGGSFRP